MYKSMYKSAYNSMYKSMHESVYVYMYITIYRKIPVKYFLPIVSIKVKKLKSSSNYQIQNSKWLPIITHITT